MRTYFQPLRNALIPKQSCINPYVFQHARAVHSGVNHRTPVAAKYEARDHGYPNSAQQTVEPAAGSRSESLLSRMPTSTLIRSLVLGTVFMSPRLTRVALPVMDRIANSQSALLSPSRNPVIKFLVKSLVYEHFCAGENKSEVALKRQAIREMGYSGVVLCCGQEIQITKDAKLHSTITAGEQDEISQWREGSLQTVDMIGDGDWMGIKFTGAGTEVTQALMQNQPPPAAFKAAIYEVCKRAAAKNCRVWIDSEQQVVQTAIDAWTIDLMRHFNQRTDGGAVVYNTLQAYLKASRSKLKHQLALARSEGWTLGLKLVRGAYIGNDQRDLIHDTKAQTDESYNGIVRDVLQGTNLGIELEEGGKLGMQLLLAGHNPESVHGAMELVETLQSQGRLAVMPEFGQLQGMGDVLGCELLDRCEGFQEATAAAAAKNVEAGAGAGGAGTPTAVPRVYKCLTWGSVQECIQYQLRRVIENSGASDRMRDGLSACAAELRRRVGRAVWPGW